MHDTVHSDTNLDFMTISDRQALANLAVAPLRDYPPKLSTPFPYYWQTSSSVSEAEYVPLTLKHPFIVQHLSLYCYRVGLTLELLTYADHSADSVKRQLPLTEGDLVTN